MPTVSVVQSKGGVGKTTLAVHIARGLQLRGYSVTLVDTDTKQGSATMWAKSGEDTPTCVQAGTIKRLKEVLRSQRSHYYVIDGAAHMKQLDAAIIRHSDILLIPIQPSPVDIWASRNLAFAAGEAVSAETNFKAAFVLSRRKKGTRLSRGISDVLETFGLPILEGTYDRVAYAEVMGHGESVEESADTSAAEEVGAILDFIITHTRTAQTNG
jgi:chromosome partitioning protein